MTHIALIEDEPPLSKQYTLALEAAGYQVTVFATKEEAEAGLNNPNFDAWVLDLSLNNDQAAGIGLIGWAKDNNIQVPILVVSGLDPHPHGRISIVLGVWDFVSKPIDDHALVHKMKLLLNAYSQSDKVLNSVDGLELDPNNPGTIVWKSKKITIPLTAWKILVQLVKSPNKCVTYEELYKCVESGTSKANLRQHITTLRNQLSSFDPDFDQIKVQTSTGYLWSE